MLFRFFKKIEILIVPIKKCSAAFLFFRLPSASVQSGQQLPRTANNVTPPLPPVTPPRMWTCTKCSYAYNPLWVEQCDICELRRTPPSLTQPSLITVTKDEQSIGIGGSGVAIVTPSTGNFFLFS